MDSTTLQRLSNSGKITPDTKARVDAELARLNSIKPGIQQLEADVNPALQGLEMDLVSSPSNELQALQNVENNVDVISKAQSKVAPQAIAATANQNAAVEQAKTRLGLPSNTAIANSAPIQDTSNSIPLDQTEAAYTPPVTTQQPQQQVAAPSLGGYDKVSEAGRKALAMGIEAAKEENGIANGYMQENAKFVEEQDRLIKDQVELAERRMLDAQDKLDQIANQEIDPGRVFKDMSVWQKLGTVILAGVAGARGADTMNRIIDNDIKAQTDLKNSGIESAKNAQTIFKDILSQYKDSIASKALLKATQLQAVQVKMNALASQTKNADFQMKLANLYNDVEANKQKALNDFNERMGKVSAVNIGPETQLNQITNKDDRERFVPGLGLAGSKEDATKLKEQGATIYSALGNISALKKYVGLGSKISPSQRAEVQSEIGTLVGAMRVPIVGPGAFTDSEREFVKDLIGDPSKLFSLDSTTKAKLAKLESILLRSRNSTAKAYGLNPAPMAQDLINPNRVK